MYVEKINKFHVAQYRGKIWAKWTNTAQKLFFILVTGSYNLKLKFERRTCISACSSFFDFIIINIYKICQEQ